MWFIKLCGVVLFSVFCFLLSYGFLFHQPMTKVLELLMVLSLVGVVIILLILEFELKQ